MKIEALFFAIILIAPVLNSNANATETVNKHAALIEQGCQMGREDAISGNIMDSSSISLKKSGDKYIELQALIRKEYEKCYLKNNSTVSGSTITNTPIPPSVETNSVSKRPAPVAEEMTKKKPIKPFSASNFILSEMTLDSSASMVTFKPLFLLSNSLK